MVTEKTIIITAPLKTELEILNKNLKIIDHYMFKHFYLYFGVYENLRIITLKSGLGKVRTAATLQFLIDNFEQINIFVNFGSCGKIDENLQIGDLIFCYKAIEYDFYTTRNFIPTFKVDFSIKDDLLDKYNIKKGIVLTATQNVDSDEKRKRLFNQFKGSVGDWEASAFLQVANLNNKKGLIFKTITDNGGNNIIEEFQQNYKQVLLNSSKKMLDFLTEFAPQILGASS